MTDKKVESVLKSHGVKFTRFHRTRESSCCGPATFFESADKKLRLVIKKRRHPYTLDAVWAKAKKYIAVCKALNVVPRNLAG